MRKLSKKKTAETNFLSAHIDPNIIIRNLWKVHVFISHIREAMGVGAFVMGMSQISSFFSSHFKMPH